MSFFAKVKQFMGIGTLEVKLQAPGHFQATDSTIEGTLHIVAKSDQSVLKIDIELTEEFQSGRDEDKREKSFKLGALHLNKPFEMKAGETKDVPFSLPFHLVKSSNAQLKEKGGLMGSIGKMGAWADNEKSSYKLVATVDVKGATLDPNDTMDMKLIK